MIKKSIFFIIIICLILILGGIFIFRGIKNYQNNLNNVVNIVFTTDINYKDYLKTTLRSAIANKNENSVYNINIICVDLPKIEQEKFKKFETKNVHINPVSVSLKDIKDVGDYEIEYFVTRADLFKFFMPELFPKLDKILYIDADTVIMKDLTELYNTDLGNKFIGVVNKPLKEFGSVTLFNHDFPAKVREYNCGVILMNLKLWREHNITKALIDEKNEEKDKELMTQSAFNAVLTQDKIKKLSPVNNIFTEWKDEGTFRSYHFWFAYFPYCIKGCNFKSLLKDAVIIHYISSNKPWNHREDDISKYWLKYEHKEDYK